VISGEKEAKIEAKIEPKNAKQANFV